MNPNAQTKVNNISTMSYLYTIAKLRMHTIEAKLKPKPYNNRQFQQSTYLDHEAARSSISILDIITIGAT